MKGPPESIQPFIKTVSIRSLIFKGLDYIAEALYVVEDLQHTLRVIQKYGRCEVLGNVYNSTGKHGKGVQDSRNPHEFGGGPEPHDRNEVGC